MTKDERLVITNLAKCNFREYYNYFKRKTEERKSMSKEEKLVGKFGLEVEFKLVNAIVYSAPVSKAVNANKIAWPPRSYNKL